MERSRAVMSKGNMLIATERAKGRVDELLRHADEVRDDSRKRDRQDRHECRACFYGGRIGGAAMTRRDCMCCGESQLYGSTATDVLCLECAKIHKLCKHCGGDLEMRTRRREWDETAIPVLNQKKEGE